MCLASFMAYNVCHVEYGSAYSWYFYLCSYMSIVFSYLLGLRVSSACKDWSLSKFIYAKCT